MGRPGTRAPDAETIRKMQSLTGLQAQILRNHDRHGEYGRRYPAHGRRLRTQEQGARCRCSGPRTCSAERLRPLARPPFARTLGCLRAGRGLRVRRDEPHT